MSTLLIDNNGQMFEKQRLTLVFEVHVLMKGYNNFFFFTTLNNNKKYPAMRYNMQASR